MHPASIRHTPATPASLERCSREGLPLGSYHLGALVASLLPAVVVTLLLRLLRLSMRRLPVAEGAIPRNAIVYLFHSDVYAYEVTHDLWRRLLSAGDAYLGYHGLKSYMGSLTPYLDGLRCMRYDRRNKSRPMAQILSFLSRNPGRFILRTDAGGPYGRVRKSLVEMALATHRPLVPMRQVASRSLIVFGHHIPLPGATIETRIGAPIEPHTLTALGIEGATRLLQARIDELAPTKKEAHLAP
jgi:hypothetical protein